MRKILAFLHLEIIFEINISVFLSLASFDIFRIIDSHLLWVALAIANCVLLIRTLFSGSVTKSEWHVDYINIDKYINIALKLIFWKGISSVIQVITL